MQNGRNVALIAPRRYGKSSLVRRASQELARKGVLVAEVDLMKTPTKERFASHLARAIHDDLASPMFKARETALKVFDSLRVKPVVTLDPADGSLGFSFSAVHGDADIDDTIERLLALPGELAAEQRQAGGRLLRRVPGRDRHRPAAPRAHAGSLPGSARCLSHLRREQEGHDEPVVQSRKRAVLPEREGHGDRAAFPRSCSPRSSGSGSTPPIEGCRTRRSTRCSGSRAGTRTRRRSSRTRSARRSRKASRARSATSTKHSTSFYARRMRASPSSGTASHGHSGFCSRRLPPSRAGCSRRPTGTHTGSPRRPPSSGRTRF